MKMGIGRGAILLAGIAAATLTGCGSGKDKITVIGRQNNSGTYEYFREEVLGKEGQFRQGISAQNGSKDVVEMVSKTPSAIGYSGHGYATDEVKVLKVAKNAGDTPVESSIENARAGKYPLSRALFIFSAGEPNPAAKHFIEWIKSKQGQDIVSAEGYVPNVEIGPDPTGNPPDGTVQMKGSDTMVQLAGKWAEVYMKAHSNVKVVVQGGGSGKGITALIDGTTDLCNSSRDMKAEERATAKEKTGKDVMENKVGMDALSIYVHKSNALDSITYEQLKGIFSKEGNVTKWSDLVGEVKK